MRKKYTVLSVLLIVVILLATGCAGNKNEKLNLAYDSIENYDYEGALIFLSSARENGEDERLVTRAEGIVYLMQGRYDESVTALEKCLAMSKGIPEKMDYDVNYYLATAYCKNGNPSEALKIYDAILDLKPEEVDALYLRGVLYAEKEDLDSAMESFNKAITLAPEDYDMLIKIYSILERNGYKEVGLNYLRTAMESGTKKMSNFEKGQISFYLEDYESAKTYLEKSKDENGAEAVLFLGKTYETLGDTSYAISVYSSYLSAGNESPEVLNQMGLCKMRMEDYEGALTAFRQAMNIEDNPMAQTLKYNEIVACEYVGDYHKACALLEAYMRTYPDDEEAKREYTFLKTR